MRADDYFLFLPAPRLTFFVREGHSPQCAVLFPSRSDHFGYSGPFPITFGPNFGSCGLILFSRTTNGLLVMSTSHADFFSTADLSLCAQTVFITRGPLPVACGPLPSRGPLPPNAHTYTSHARTAVFSLRNPSERLLSGSLGVHTLNKRTFVLRARTVSCYKRTSDRRQRTFCVPVGGPCQP